MSHSSSHTAGLPGPSDSSLGTWAGRALSSLGLSRGFARLRIGISFGSSTEGEQGRTSGTATPSSNSLTSDASAPAATDATSQATTSDVVEQEGSGPGQAAEIPGNRQGQSSIEPGLSPWLERNSPVVGLFLLVFLHEHIVGLSWYFCMSYLLSRGNEVVKGQARQSELQRRKLFCVVCALPAGVGCALVGRLPLRLWRVFGLMAPQIAPLFWDQFFAMALADVCIRLLTAVSKAVVLLMYPVPSSPSTEAGRRRARLLTFVEHLSLLYRCCTPTAAWSRYFAHVGLPAFISQACTGLYLGSKGVMVYDRLKCTWASALPLLRSVPAYGQPATAEEVMEAGNSCAICQSAMEHPMKLCCNHIFCDGCIGHWFDFDHNTCPMCRAVVRPASVQSYGDGQTSMLPQMF